MCEVFKARLYRIALKDRSSYEVIGRPVFVCRNWRAKTCCFFSDFFAVFTLVFLLFFHLEKSTFWYARKNRRFARTKRRSILPKGRFTKIIRRFAVSKMSICRNRVSICGVFVGSLRVGSRFSGLFCELSASFYRFLSHWFTEKCNIIWIFVAKIFGSLKKKVYFCNPNSR